MRIGRRVEVEVVDDVRTRISDDYQVIITVLLKKLLC